MFMNAEPCNLTRNVPHALAAVTYAVETSTATPVTPGAAPFVLPLRGWRMVLL